MQFGSGRYTLLIVGIGVVVAMLYIVLIIVGVNAFVLKPRNGTRNTKHKWNTHLQLQGFLR